MRNLWGKVLAGILLSSVLMACGSEMVNITLLTPIPVANPTRNLAEAMLVQGGSSNALVATISGPSCKQRELRAGFKAPGWKTLWVPVELDTELIDFQTTELSNKIADPSSRPTGPTPIPVPASLFLNQSSTLRRPIVIPVPKGVAGELALQGVVVEPIGNLGSTSLNEDGTPCKKLFPATKPIKSFAVYGSSPFKTKNATQTALEINVIQSTRPTTFGLVPGTYTLPTPSPLDFSGSDFKCRLPNEPKSCGNRGLFRLKIDFAVSAHFLIQHPPPPSNETLRMYMGLPYLTANLTTNTYYLPQMSPLLLSYPSGSIDFEVLLQFYEKKLSYRVNGVRVDQPLFDCATQGSPGKGFVGNLPTDLSPSPTPALGCGTNDFNFSISDQGLGFD